MLSRVLRAIEPRNTAHAHCDIPCGVYDPAQARIEAESCYKIIQKYHDSSDELFRARCIHVKEERAELTKHHIDVMWHDYFKPEHVEKFPDLHDVCWKASKQASQVKRTRRHRRGAEAARSDRQDRQHVARDRRPGRDPIAGRLLAPASSQQQLNTFVDAPPRAPARGGARRSGGRHGRAAARQDRSRRGPIASRFPVTAWSRRCARGTGCSSTPTCSSLGCRRPASCASPMIPARRSG